MAKRKRLSQEEIRQQNYKRVRQDINFCPEPTYSFSVGERVHIGNLKDVCIVSVMDNGKIYEVEHGEGEERTKDFFAFYHIRPLSRAEGSIVENENVRFNFSTQTISGQLSKVLFFGVDFSPEYQRDFVWSQEDREKLIDSVFNNIDIGKFVFIHLPWVSSTSPAYEILDGKQRLMALVDFYLNKFQYKGKFFNELSFEDQRWFENFYVSVAEVRENISLEQKLKYFLMLNTSGHVVSSDHLKKVRCMLNNVKEEL